MVPRSSPAVVIGTDRWAIVAALARHAPEVPVAEVVPGDDGPMTGPLPAAVRRAVARPGETVSTDRFRDHTVRGRASADAVAGRPVARSGA